MSPAPSNTQDYSKEGVVIERYVTRVSYDADGSGTRESQAAIHVQAEAGVQNFAVLAFPFTSADETVSFDYVRVRKPDGTVVATPDYNTQDLPADISRVAPMYSDIHEKHVTVKALGVGDTLEYLVRYRIVKPQVPGQFWFEDTFVKDTIVRDEELEISVPREKYVKVSSPELQPQMKDDGPRRIYTWKTANLERRDDANKAKKEENESKPSVQLTTFHSWEEVGAWYGGLQRPQQAITPEIKAKTAELTRGLTNDDDKIRALYKFVSTHFHYVSLSFGIGRYQPHLADDVLGNEYGDCKDKHTLLAALLQSAGYDAWPALINSSRKIDSNLPSPGQFDHVITVVPRGSNLLWLDTTPEVAPFGLLLASLRDRQVLVIPTEKPATLMTTPKVPPFTRSEIFSAEGKLGADGILTAHMQQNMRGDSEILLRLAYRRVPPAQWKELTQKLSYLSGFGGDVSNVNASVPEDTDKPFHLEYDYTRKGYSDWENRRITPPFPPFGIESSKDDEETPAEPLILGAPGKLEYRAKVELPFDALHIPEDVDLVQDFAEYHASYKVENHILTAVRQLTIKEREVQLAVWADYLKFRKALTDDENRMTQLEGEKAGTAAAKSSSPEADRKYREALDAYQRHDLIATQEAVRRVIELDPKYRGAHSMLAVTYLVQNKRDAAIDELHKEEEVNPADAKTYQIAAQALTFMHRRDEAMEEWRKLLKVDPKNHDAAATLSRMLLQAQKYPEAVEVLEAALKQAPDSPSLQLSLGAAYVKSGQKEKGLTTLKQAIARQPASYDAMNTAAYSLAEANFGLDQAMEYAEKAVRQVEDMSANPAISEEDGLSTTRKLGFIWDTLGWVYFRQENLEKATAYIRAAWLLSQDPVAGDHLGQIYEHQGKTKEAAHLYELALASVGGDKSEIQKHYEHLTGRKSPDSEPPILRRSPQGGHNSAPSYISAGGELSEMRTVKLPMTEHKIASAVFSIVFSAGKVEDVKYVSGSEELKAMAIQIKQAKFKVEFPDDNPTRLMRRGILSCGTIAGCDFVLLPPDTPHAADYMPGPQFSSD